MFKLAVITATLLLGGCLNVKQNLLDGAFSGSTSKFQPVIATEKKLAEYEALVKENNNKVVEDEKGIYYHSYKSGGLSRVVMQGSERDALASLFKNHKGLLLPILKFNSQMQITADWKNTEARHKLLSKTMSLDLLPIPKSREFFEAFIAAASQGGSYSHETLAKLSEKIGANAGYLVTSGAYEDLFNNYTAFRDGTDFREDFASVRYFANRIGTQSSINFIPVAKASAATGGFVYFQSSCLHIDLAVRAKVLRYIDQSATATSSGGTSKQQLMKDQLDHETKMTRAGLSLYLEQVNKQDAWNGFAETICPKGFEELGISGRIKSSTLR